MIKSKILAIALKELGVILKKIQNSEAYFPVCGYGGFANHSIIRIRKLVNCPRNCGTCPLGSWELKVGKAHLCSLRDFNLFSQLDSVLTVKGYDDAENLIQPFINKLEDLLSSESEANQQVSLTQAQEEKESCVPMKTLFQTALLIGGIIAAIVALAA